MATGFMMTNANMEAASPSPHEPTSVKEEPRQPRRSARMSNSRPSYTHHGPAVPTAGMAPAAPVPPPPPPAGARRTRLNGATLQSISPSRTDTPAAGSCDARQAEDGARTPLGGPLTTERHDSLMVGDGGTTAGGGGWVRFAWEPLVAVGKRRSSPVPVAGSGSFGVGSAPETGGVTLLQELSAGPGRHGSDKGVKRARASSADAGAETGWTEGSRDRRRASLPDRVDWDWGAGWPRRQQCWRQPTAREFEAGGLAAVQMGGAGNPPDPGNLFPVSSRELASAADAAGRPAAGHGQTTQPAIGSRGHREHRVGGVNARSGVWGGGGELGDATAEKEAEIEGTGATAVTEAYREHREERDSQEGGRRAKKPRYHGSRVQHTLSVAQMDTLTDGVSSLGVASPEEACNGDSEDGRGASPALDGRCGHILPQDILNGSTNDGLSSEAAARPIPPLWEVGRNGGTRGVGPGRSAWTRHQAAHPGAAAGGPGHHQPKRRRNGSHPAGKSPFR